ASYAVRQNKLTLVFTTALRTGNAIADHVYLHGDGVKVICLRVADAVSAWEETTKRGAKSYLSPLKTKDENGEIVLSGIHLYGETVHLFIERKNYSGVFMPGYKAWKTLYKPTSAGLLYVDHCVANVDWNQMD